MKVVTFFYCLMLCACFVRLSVSQQEVEIDSTKYRFEPAANDQLRFMDALKATSKSGSVQEYFVCADIPDTTRARLATMLSRPDQEYICKKSDNFLKFYGINKNARVSKVLKEKHVAADLSTFVEKMRIETKDSSNIQALCDIINPRIQTCPKPPTTLSADDLKTALENLFKGDNDAADSYRTTYALSSALGWYIRNYEKPRPRIPVALEKSKVTRTEEPVELQNLHLAMLSMQAMKSVKGQPPCFAYLTYDQIMQKIAKVMGNKNVFRYPYFLLGFTQANALLRPIAAQPAVALPLPAVVPQDPAVLQPLPPPPTDSITYLFAMGPTLCKAHMEKYIQIRAQQYIGWNVRHYFDKNLRKGKYADQSLIRSSVEKPLNLFIMAIKAAVDSRTLYQEKRHGFEMGDRLRSVLNSFETRTDHFILHDIIKLAVEKLSEDLEKLSALINSLFDETKYDYKEFSVQDYDVDLSFITDYLKADNNQWRDTFSYAKLNRNDDDASRAQRTQEVFDLAVQQIHQVLTASDFTELVPSGFFAQFQRNKCERAVNHYFDLQFSPKYFDDYKLNFPKFENPLSWIQAAQSYQEIKLLKYNLDDLVNGPYYTATTYKLNP